MLFLYFKKIVSTLRNIHILEKKIPYSFNCFYFSKNCWYIILNCLYFWTKWQPIFFKQIVGMFYEIFIILKNLKMYFWRYKLSVFCKNCWHILRNICYFGKKISTFFEFYNILKNLRKYIMKYCFFKKNFHTVFKYFNFLRNLFDHFF